MKSIIVEIDVRDQAKFGQILGRGLSQFKIILSPDSVNPAEVEYVIIWRSYPNYLNSLINLKAVLICGSGIDHIIKQQEVLEHIPLIRLVDPYLKSRVSEYVYAHISANCRFMINSYKNDSNKGNNWCDGIRIGIMGYGQIGKFLAQYLLKKRFQVIAWSKRPNLFEGIQVFSGSEELNEFLINLDVLVCALPLTDDTRGILNESLFQKLNSKCYLINIGRGDHLIDDDLLQALKSNKLSGASIDVINVASRLNYLSAADRTSLNLTLTPHIAGYISAETQAPEAVLKISEIEGGNSPETMVSYNNQY